MQLRSPVTRLLYLFGVDTPTAPLVLSGFDAGFRRSVEPIRVVFNAYTRSFLGVGLLVGEWGADSSVESECGGLV